MQLTCNSHARGLTPDLCCMQFAFNTLSRVTPVAHGVCNVVKRVCIIGTSVVFFGNAMTNQTKLGTVIALIGEWHLHQSSL
jgi:Triose-phosphate Transporter family